MSTPENKTVTILARYSFSDAEIRQIALKMAASASEYSQTTVNGGVGPLIREEAMDFQRDLPLEETPIEAGDQAAEVRCDYMSPTYGCCQLPVGHDGCHAFDGHKLRKSDPAPARHS